MYKGKLKRKLRRRRIIKKTLSCSFGVLLVATAIGIPAYVNNTSQPQIAERAPFETEVTIPEVSVVDNPKDMVTAPNGEGNKETFISWANSFNEWCCSFDQVMVTYEHSFVVDNNEHSFGKVTEQLDKTTGITHITSEHQLYDAEVYCKDTDQSYYLNIIDNGNSIGWTHVTKDSDINMQRILGASTSPMFTLTTLKDMIDTVVKSNNFVVYEGIDGDNFVVQSEIKTCTDPLCQPAFSTTCDVDTVSINLQKFADRVDIIVKYTYTNESPTKSEQMTYSITPTNGLTVEFPESVKSESTQDTTKLNDWYKKIGG